MRSERLALIALATAALGAACSEPESFVVLSLQSSSTTPIDNVDQIEVQVLGACAAGTAGCKCLPDNTCLSGNVCMSNRCMALPGGGGGPVAKTRTLFYEAHGMSINQTEKKTLSVGFSHGETGSVTFTVDLLNSVTCSLAHGEATAAIAKGSVVETTVTLTAGLDCSHADGGAPDVPPGSTLPGCDPVNPQGSSADGGAGADGGADGGVQICAANQTCQVDCTPPNNAAPRNECVMGGTGGPGTACSTNADCMPGTQCFNYASTGCAVKLCLRFCNNNTDCAAFGAGGGGPGSFCEGPVMCPAFLTAYHTCTFNCDPRAAAAANRGGCPMGLACVMPGAMDEVDCACPEATRTKTEGEVCNTGADCATGLICNQMAGTKTCRAICRCDANNTGGCTAPVNDCPKSGTTCHAVTNNTIYGVCF